jgi:hypothetical protein
MLKFYDNFMEDNDKIGFIRFNQVVKIVFDPHERGKNAIYLRKTIQDAILIEPSGETALYNALYEALKMLRKIGIHFQILF